MGRHSGALRSAHDLREPFQQVAQGGRLGSAFGRCVKGLPLRWRYPDDQRVLDPRASARRQRQKKTIDPVAWAARAGGLRTKIALVDAAGLPAGATKGEKAWPPLAMFNALLLAIWHDLSDVALAGALPTGRASGAFCGFSCAEVDAERAAFRRLPAQALMHGLDRNPVPRPSPAISSPRAACVARARSSMPPVIRLGQQGRQGCRLGQASHAGACAWLQGPPCGCQGTASSAASRRPRPTRPMSISRLQLSPMSRARFMPTWAYDALAVEKAIEAERRNPEAHAQGPSLAARREAREAHDRLLRPIRARIERIFGTWNRSDRFRCMQWIGLSKARLQVHLAVIADNVKRYGACKPPERTRNADSPQNGPSAKPVTTTPSHRSAGDLQSATLLKCLPNHTRRRPTKCHPRALISFHVKHFCPIGAHPLLKYASKIAV